MAFGLLWILAPHLGLKSEPSFSLSLWLIAIVISLGLRLWWIHELSHGGNVSHRCSPPQWPTLLIMGLGLATTTGSAVILEASLVTGIIW